MNDEIERLDRFSIDRDRVRVMVAPAELPGWRADGLVNVAHHLGDGWDLVDRGELGPILAPYGVTAAALGHVLAAVDRGRTACVYNHGTAIAATDGGPADR